MSDTDESRYTVNIELKDQYNNVFYIDNVNNYETSIRLKDFSFNNTNKREIIIYKDIYSINSSVIQELKTIFKEYLKNSGNSSYPSNYYDRRTPIEKAPNDISNLMTNTKELAQLCEVFTRPNYSKLIKDNIIHFNQTSNSRTRPLTDESTINRTILDNFKYISNDNKTSDFYDDERMDTLMFNNIMYLLKNSFLKKETILISIQNEKYYVDEISFYDLPYLHMIKKDYERPRTIYIYLKVKTTPIIDIPTIRIFYVVDDIEVKNIKISAPRELKPVDIDKDFANYKTMYMFDNFKYVDENDNMNAFYNSLKNEKRMNKIQELFLNADIVNKYQKRYNHHNKNKITAFKKKKEEDQTAIKRKNVNANIRYLLREKFNLHDNKILIDNAFVDDTYIAYDISNITNKDTQVKYNSIMTNKTYNNYDNSEKDDTLKGIFSNYITRTQSNYEASNLFYANTKADSRLEAIVYNVLLVFRMYKQDSLKKKPTLMRRYIGEECLSGASTLDKILSKLIYRRVGLPDKFLYDKLTKINNNEAITVASNIIAPNIIAPNMIPPNNPITPSIKGGTKKYNTKKYTIKKYNTKKYNTKKYNTKKYNTKKYNTKK